MAPWQSITLLAGNQPLEWDGCFLFRNLHCKYPCSSVFTWIRLRLLLMLFHLFPVMQLAFSPPWPLQHLIDMFILSVLNDTHNISYINYVKKTDIYDHFCQIHKKTFCWLFTSVYLVSLASGTSWRSQWACQVIYPR